MRARTSSLIPAVERTGEAVPVRGGGEKTEPAIMGACGVEVPDPGVLGRRVDVEAKTEERVAVERRWGRLDMEEAIDGAGDDVRLGSALGRPESMLEWGVCSGPSSREGVMGALSRPVGGWWPRRMGETGHGLTRTERFREERAWTRRGRGGSARRVWEAECERCGLR